MTTKKEIRKGWGLFNLTKRGVKVTEVVICKKKPHYDEFFEGEIRSHIIPVKVMYDIPKLKKRGDYYPRSGKI